jgi:hypothetical protein
VDTDPAGRRLQEAIAALLAAKGIAVAYVVGQALYQFEHLLPMLCTLPGPIVSTETVDRIQQSRSDRQSWRRFLAALAKHGLSSLHITSTTHVLRVVGKGNNTLLISSVGFGASLDHQSVVELSHGIDDDQLYKKYTGAVDWKKGTWSGEQNRVQNKKEFARDFLSCRRRCSVRKGPTIDQKLMATNNNQQQSRLLYAETAVRIRRAFGYDESDSPTVLRGLLPADKPPVFVNLPKKGYGMKASFWEAAAPDLEELSAEYTLLVRAHPLEMGLPSSWANVSLVDVTRLVWAWPLVKLAAVVRSS